MILRYIKRIASGILFLLLCATLATAGGWLWLRASLPVEQGLVRLDGLDKRIEILRDGNGVPHIFADSEKDAYFALGFVHAQDRLWQMEFFRRLGTGRLSEAIGAPGLGHDRFIRTLGVARMAAASFEKLAPDTRRALEFYAAGVNAWMKTRTGPLPPEFVLLDIEPEPWRPADSLLWGALMSLRLSGNWSQELLRARLLKTLDPGMLPIFYPPYPADGPATVPARSSLLQHLPLALLWAALPAAELRRRSASNQWVVSGARSKSGKPLLANDPHLGFTAPGLWYLARIVTPQFTITGATVPGLPFALLGHNRRIAWGFTTTNGDLEDLFIEQLDPDDPTRYVTPAGSRPFTSRVETIRVKDKPDVILTVRETRHGPVLDGLIADSEVVAGAGHVLALATSFLNPSNRTAEALYRINRATNWRTFRAALTLWQAPQQNMTYADVDGNIGFYAPGRVPVRAKGDGFLPVPGWSGKFDWTGFVPFAELPHAFNPARGVIVNANNAVAPPGSPPFISREWETPHRARRIEDMLKKFPKLTIPDAAAMQTDNLSLAAKELLPALLAAPARGERSTKAIALLSHWDGRMVRDRPEPLIFTAWVLELSTALYAPYFGDLLPDYMRVRPLVLRRFLSSETLCTRAAPKSQNTACAERVADALDAALARLTRSLGGNIESWRWGALHQAVFRHRVFEQIPLIGKALANFAVATDGGDYTVNRGSTSFGNEATPFRHVHGAGLRAIYDLSNLANSRFMLATGQSGNPFSLRYSDLNKRWANFDYLILGAPRKELLATGARQLILAPAASQGEKRQ